MCHNYVICTIGPFHKPKTSLFISCKKNIRVESTLTNLNHQLKGISFVTPVALHLRFNGCKSSENSRNWVTIFTFLILTQRALSPLLYDIHARLWFEVHSYRSIDNKKKLLIFYERFQQLSAKLIFFDCIYLFESNNKLNIRTRGVKQYYLINFDNFTIAINVYHVCQVHLIMN